MNTKELVMNAIDSDGFQTTTASAGYINPELWNRQVLKMVEDTIVVAGYAKVYDDILGAPGDSFNVTINSAPSAATAVAESDDVSISTYAVTTVQFSPTEYAAAYNLSDKEARRGFYNIAQDMIQKLGYSLALKRETAAISLLQSGAGNTVTANGVSAGSIASSDKIDYDDIVNLRKEIVKDKLLPKVLFVSPGQYTELLKNQAFRDASQYGGRETVFGGRIVKVAGIDVVETTLITPTSSKSKAIMLGYDMGMVPPFGIGRKSLPKIERQRHALGRYVDIVAVEEWDMQILRADGVGTLQSYDA